MKSENMANIRDNELPCVLLAKDNGKLYGNLTVIGGGLVVGGRKTILSSMPCNKGITHLTFLVSYCISVFTFAKSKRILNWSLF